MLKLISKSLLAKLSPLHLFTVGGVSTFFVLRGLKFLAQRSKTVNQGLHKGFEVVEDKLDDLKGRVLVEKAEVHHSSN